MSKSILDCEYAEKGEWGPVIECDHPKSKLGYCNLDSCPKKCVSKL